MKDKIIFSLLVTLCIALVQVAYAEPEFSLEFGSTGTGNDNLNNPTDVILDKRSNKVYVVDSNNNRINVFEKNGDHDFKYGTFCDIAKIQDCNNDASGASRDGEGQFNNPISIAREDALKEFFVVDSDNNRIQVFDDKGKFQREFGSSDSGVDEYLGSAKGIVVQDSTKKILVSNIEKDSISVFDKDENFLVNFDSFNGNDSFENLTNMIIDDSEEKLYVADSGKDRIVVFELVTGNTCPDDTVKAADGVCFVEEFGSSGNDKGKFDNPTGLAFDLSNDLLYVADTNNDRIQIFEIVNANTCPSGMVEIINGVCFVEEFGTSGSDNGEFDTPTGIALDKTNDFLYVADSKNNRIQVFNLNPGPVVLLPDRPDNLKATPVSPTSIIASWDEPEMAEGIPSISGYKIEYKMGSGSYTTINNNTASSATSFIHEGLDSSETYSYRVYSINSEGTSTSSSASTKPGHTREPAALTATPISPTQIKLSWLPPSETFGQTITGYDIKRENKQDVYSIIGDTDSKTTTFTVPNLETDKKYTYVVSAKLGIGSTDESISASATPRDDSEDTTEESIKSTVVQKTVPTSPIKLTASGTSSTQIDLAWSPPAEDGNSEILGYKIEVKIDNGSFSPIVDDTKSTATKYSHKNLIASSQYTYRVSSINDVGIGDPSNESSATPELTNIQISPIRKLTIDEGKLLSFTVKLVDNSIKDAVFSLEKSSLAGAKITPNTGMFSWTPTSSDGGKTYTFDIVAKKGGLSDRTTVTVTVNDVVDDSQPKELGIAPFVDESKDVQSYVDRYNTEDAYKEWFDKTYPEYDSIYHAVGLEEPLPVPAPFVDESKDVQSYVDRYNTEDAYKEWFDKTYSEYDSIYHAVGLEEPLPVPAPFVDESKDVQSYVDRYNTEDAYKEWFDKTYSEYDSIYQAVGLEEPLPVPAPFVDESKDVQSYVDRYNTEDAYKEWFDKTYSEYDSIYQAVGLEEPKIEEKKFGICGPGTKLIDGVCKIVDNPSSAKPWWRFW